MESSIAAVDREVDRILSKFNYIDKHTANSLQELLTHVEGIKIELRQCCQDGDQLSLSHLAILTQCITRVKEAVARLSLEHKELHGGVSKVGKAIDKNFVSDFNSICIEGAFDGDDNKREINQVICEHFLRQGMLDLAESLVMESGLESGIYQKEPFLELHYILEALKAHNLWPALKWVDEYREQLKCQNSSLEFRLHRLFFIDILRNGFESQMEAIAYAKNFAPFAAAHTKDIQVLMGSLLYLRQGIQNSPYAHLFNPIAWTEIADTFIHDSCTLLGLSVDSPLSIVVKAGCVALPPLLTLKQMMQQRQCSSVWSAKDELPVEIDLGRECRFHSVFACPILRQQSSDGNPPVRLICGHVISRDALNKLTTSNKWAILPNPIIHKLKCPYCPVEQAPSEATLIHF